MSKTRAYLNLSHMRDAHQDKVKSFVKTSGLEISEDNNSIITIVFKSGIAIINFLKKLARVGYVSTENGANSYFIEE